MSLVRLDPSDSVAVARERLDPGQEVEGISVRDAIPPGHKLAVQPIS